MERKFGFITITKKKEQRQKINETLNKLEKKVKEAKILEAVVIRNKEEFEEFLTQELNNVDVFLVFKKCLGFGVELSKLVERDKPIVLFQDPKIPNFVLDSIEYLPRKRSIFMALDFDEINKILRYLKIKKDIENTKVLILNSDFPFYIERVRPKCASAKTIRARFGVEVEEVSYKEFLEKWNSISLKRAKAIAKEWIAKAKAIIEPSENDVTYVARLYLAIKALLKERKAQALTLIYGESPFPVPCLAYTYLRDEGIPAACEGDINSLLMMIILHHLAKRPAYMGNTVWADIKNNVIAISHCVIPTKMKGYASKQKPYILRNYHGLKFKGSVTAYCELNKNQNVTITRLKGDLTKMLVYKGKIVSCKDYEDPQLCRAVVKIRVKDAKGFIEKTFGNHHVLVYGDFADDLGVLGSLFGIEVVKA